MQGLEADLAHAPAAPLLVDEVRKPPAVRRPNEDAWVDRLPGAANPHEDGKHQAVGKRGPSFHGYFAGACARRRVFSALPFVLP